MRFLTLVCFLLYINHGDSLITGIAVRLPLEGDRAEPGAPWPLPHQWDQSMDLKTIDPPNFLFTTNLAGCDVIDQAFQRHQKLIDLDRNGEVDASLDLLEQLDVQIQSTECGADYYPNTASDESYTLNIDDTSIASLYAPSIWGALRGLETFSQLIFLNEETLYQLNQTSIEDAPRFYHRGLLVDTCRHFIPMPKIMKILDAMSWDKLNVFHWHVVDDQAFPYPIEVFPNMSELGAYTHDHIYSRDDVNTIIQEARLRGIRVVPEFDTPGHTYSWGLSLPKLITPCWGAGLEGGPNVADYPNHGPAEIINPMEGYVYDVMEQIIKEVAEDFPDDYIHLGMDEVYYACWQSNPNISQWMQGMNFTEYHQVEQYYQVRLIDIVREHGSKYIIWQDPTDNGVTVHADTLVQVWKGSAENWHIHMERVAGKGYRTLLSSPWYLNKISYGQDWREYYLIEPTNFTSDETMQGLVQGGEATAWAEYLDGSNILSLLWPRLSAVAERLWSAKDVRDADSAAFRLDQQRCRMVRRGISAKPILPGYCGDYDWGMEREDGETRHDDVDGAYSFHSTLRHLAITGGIIAVFIL